MAAAETFTIRAAAGTDVWRKPPSTDVFNATAAPAGAQSHGPLSAFRSARVSFAFAYAEQYDQAGLLLSMRRGGSPSSSPPARWIKTGVEYYDGRPMLSTVACHAWADWSVAPRPADGQQWTTVLLERGRDHNGVSLWVYQLEEGADGPAAKLPLREICWVFADNGDDDGQEAWQLTVEAMAARPQQGAAAELEAQFRGFDVQWTTTA